MAPTTLRELMGLSDQPTALRETTLIMIDCQNTYRRGIMQLEGAEAALAEAARLLARARAAGIPVVHIMHDAGEGLPVRCACRDRADQRSGGPYPGRARHRQELPQLVRRDRPGRPAREAPGRELILAGFMTHMCVNSTARGAFSLGYHPTVVASATATRELPGPGGTPVPAAAVQAASLAAIGDLFGVVVSKADDIPD